MICKNTLESSSGKVRLRTIELSDCTQEYLGWLQDPQVNRFLETRWEKQSIPKIRAFVEDVRKSNHSCLFAILALPQAKHIGNIKIGPIHPHYSHADISYFIGDPSSWGKGYATEAISLITEWAFSELGLHKVQAGAFDENIGSIRALQKAGFSQEACFKENLISPVSGKYCDHLMFGRVNPYQNSYCQNGSE